MTAPWGSYLEERAHGFQISRLCPGGLCFGSDRTAGKQNHVGGRKVANEFNRRISTGELNRVLAEATKSHPPPLYQGKRLKFYYATQTAVRPPTFVFFANRADGVHFSYERYLTNQLREAFGFSGSPIRLISGTVSAPNRDKNALLPPCAGIYSFSFNSGLLRLFLQGLIDPARICMSLVGNLQDLGLGEILQIVSLSRKSGILSLQNQSREGKVILP